MCGGDIEEVLHMSRLVYFHFRVMNRQCVTFPLECQRVLCCISTRIPEMRVLSEFVSSSTGINFKRFIHWIYCNLVFCSFVHAHRTFLCSGGVRSIQYDSACRTLLISYDQQNRCLSSHLILSSQQNWNGGHECRRKSSSRGWMVHLMGSSSCSEYCAHAKARLFHASAPPSFSSNRDY